MTECANCHQEIKEGFSFCPSCGATAPDAQVAEQIRLLAQQEAEKERKKAERIQQLAAKKVARQQRQAERQALQSQKKEERARKLAEKKALKAAGLTVAGPTPSSSTTSSVIRPANNFTAIWVLVVISTILAMGVAGTVAFLIVRHFFS